MSFLLDTDTRSAYFKRDRRVEGRFLQNGGQLHVSVITVGELFSGVLSTRASSRLLPGLLAMLKDTTILDATYDVAYTFGAIRAPLLDRGLPAPGMDLMNAATALVHNLTLVTHNTQDYANVPGLRLVDWLVP
jgi:predicted nucleic acid-binding protein